MPWLKIFATLEMENTSPPSLLCCWLIKRLLNGGMPSCLYNFPLAVVDIATFVPCFRYIQKVIVPVKDNHNKLSLDLFSVNLCMEIRKSIILRVRYNKPIVLLPPLFSYEVC